MRPAPLALVVLCALGGSSFAPPVQAEEPARPSLPEASEAEPLTIGDTFTVDSKVLGETRRINVYRPAAYALADDAPLPVLYMPDGGSGEDFLHIAGLVQIGALNGTMRPFLLVGIENTDRRHDLTGPTQSEEDRKIAPPPSRGVGGSAAFREFLRSELMPVVRSRYPTTGETAIVGESLAGLFVVETFLLEPDLFDHYVAVDPSLWWDGGRLVDQAATRVAKHPEGRSTLFLTTSRQAEIAALTTRLAKILTTLRQAGTTDVEVRQLSLPDEEHATVYHPAALQAFRTVFAPEPAAERP